MTDSTDWLPLLLLREDVEELRHLRQRPAQTQVTCPALQPALWEERDAVDLVDLLTATLSAMSRSRGLLKGAAGIALADDPIPFTFKGELVGVSEGADRLWLVVKADAGRKDHA
jgi:hypothetical protein